MTDIETLHYETSDKAITLRVEQWAHIVTVLEVANGGAGRVDQYLLPDLITEICSQLFREGS